MRSKWFPGPRSQVAGLLLLLATAYSLQPTACFAQVHPHSFSPRMLSGSLQVWLRADAITGLNDGDGVATWPDSSGNGRDFTQSTVGWRPLYKTAIRNGRPVVRFAAAGTRLDYPPGLNFTSMTVFVVGKANAAPFTFILPSAYNWYYFAVASNSLWWGYATLSPPIGDRVTVIDPALGAWHVYSAWRSNIGSSYLLSQAIDGGSGTSVAVEGDPLLSTSASIGAWPWDPPTFRPLDGDIAEIVIYNQALSDRDRQRVERYLARKWGL